MSMNGTERGMLLNCMKTLFPEFAGLRFSERANAARCMLERYDGFSFLSVKNDDTGEVRREIRCPHDVSEVQRVVIDYLSEFHGYVVASAPPEAIEMTEVVVDELSDMTDAERASVMSHDAILRAMAAAFPKFEDDSIKMRRKRAVAFVYAHPGVNVVDVGSRHEIRIHGPHNLDVPGRERLKLAIEYLSRFHDYVVVHVPNGHDELGTRQGDEAFVSHLRDLDNALKSIDLATKEMRGRTWDAQVLSEIATYRTAAHEVITKLRELCEQLRY